MKDAGTPTLRQVKTSERQMEREDSATKQVVHSHDQLPRRKPKSKPGLSLGKRIELEKHRRYVLMNEHNSLMFVVREKEAKLKELQDKLKLKNFQSIDYHGEDVLKQRIRQLENNTDKMKMKIAEAQKIQTVYQNIREHLQQEVRGMSMVLEKKERAVATGQAKMDKASKQLESASAAADSILDKMVHMIYETMQRKREMDRELCELGAEEKELKRKIQTLGRLSPTVHSRMTEQEIEEAQATSVEDLQCFDVCGASQSDMTVIEEMEALREALGCADVQDLVTKVVSQRAAKQQLLLEVTQCEEQAEQEAKTLADLEVQHAQLKFGAKPASTWSDKLKEQMQAQLCREQGCVERLQAELKQSQDLLDTVERGINNLFFRVSCVPVEGLPSVSSPDSVAKLRDVSARLPTLQQKASQQKPEISSLDQEQLYCLLEELNTKQLRNNKRLSTPTDTPQLSDDDEVPAPSREEIKRSSISLIEAKSLKKGRKK